MNPKMIPLVGLLFALSLLVLAVNAQSQTSQTYWHNSDYYSIQLDGAGNAFVSEEMNLQSLSRSAVNTITLEIPYANVAVYRIISVNGSYGGCINCVAPQSTSQPYPYYNSNPQFVNYTTASTSNSTVLTMHLDQPLVNSSQTTVYIFFSAKGLAQKAFQGYQFTFKTVIDNNALVREAYASVEIPQNMYLKGEPTFNINYDTASAQGSLISAPSASAAVAFLPSIFYYNYQYHSSNLLPGEYFTITGLYGSNIALLYLQEILIGLVVVIFIVWLLKVVFLSKIRRIFVAKGKGKSHFSFTRSMLVGAVSGFLFQIAFFAIQVLYSFMNGFYYYSSPLPILFTLLSLVVYAFALFGLPYYLYSRFDKKEGIIAGIISIVASIIYFIIIIYLFSSPLIIAPLV